MTTTAQKTLVALSGGVDSAVAALLLKQAGHTVTGVYMRTWMNEEGQDPFTRCPWEDDRDSARAVADHLGIAFQVVNMIETYRERVVSYLVDGYRKGYTPNPDIMCNREVKFGVLLDYARAQGYDALATGHYCQRRENEDGTIDLLQGSDRLKDQSYFLAMIQPAALSFVRFPIGHLQKSEVRALAQTHGLPNAERKDSQGICFLGDVKIQEFLRHYIADNPGPIINQAGKVLGEHRGLHRYTLGQRKGIGIPSNTDNENYVVVNKDIKNNCLIVAFDKPATPDLYTRTVSIDGLNWLHGPILTTMPLLARPRYRDPAQPAIFTPLSDSPTDATLTFQEPQRALATGQVVALYQNDLLLGGGVYKKAG